MLWFVTKHRNNSVVVKACKLGCLDASLGDKGIRKTREGGRMDGKFYLSIYTVVTL